MPASSSSILVRLATMALVLLSAMTSPVDAAPPAVCLRPPVNAPVVDPYRPPACTWCPGNRGIDYGTRPRTGVRAGAAGTVVFAGPVAGLVWVSIVHAGDLLSSYGPMARLEVRRGQVVTDGQPLGTTAGMLHLGVRLHGRYIDPALVLWRAVHLVPRLVRLDGRIPRPPTRRCPAAPPRPVAGPRLPSASLATRPGSVPGTISTRSILSAVARR